jgi:hypothetical protein
MTDYEYMRKLIFSIMLLVATVSVYYGCDSKKEQVKKVVVHDTIYRDTLVVTVPKLMFYNEKWVRSQFEKTDYKLWENYKDGYKIEYPSFMYRTDLKNPDERKIELEFHGITMSCRAYDDKYDMSVREKFEAVGLSAVTTSLADSSFTLAGGCGENRLYFEKDILLRPRTWMYLRVVFPSELTWAVDPLLHYVKDFQP